MRLVVALVALLLLPVTAARAQLGTCLPPFCTTSGGTGTPTPSPGSGPVGNVPAPVRPLSPVTGTVTEGVDPAHTNAIPGHSIAAPLRLRWSRRVRARSALAGGGRIYAFGTRRMSAHDPVTGRELWSVAAPSGFAAYDGGRLFIAHDGSLTAFSAADGSQLWTVTFSEMDTFSNSPVATGGVVYLSEPKDGGVMAVDGATGRRYWTAAQYVSQVTPAVDATAAFTSDGCGRTVAVERATGALRWRTTAACSGPGSGPDAIAGGRLLVLGDSAARDPGSGRLVGRYPGGPPVVAGRTVITDKLVQRRDGTEATALVATDAVSGRRRWRRITPEGEGIDDGTASPIGLGGLVFTLREGKLAARSIENGALLWSDRRVVRPPGVADAFLEAAPDLLLVGGGGRLHAYESVFSPGPRQLQAAVARRDVLAGGRIRVLGRVGEGVRSGEVRIAVARFPSRRFRSAGTARIRPDGGFRTRLRADRNVRIRVSRTGTHRKVLRAFVYPRVRFRVRQRGGLVRAGVRIRTARDVRLSGRRAVVYLTRPKARRYQRVGVARLRRTGRGRAAGTASFKPLARVGAKSGLVACIPGQVRLGLGRAYDLTRRCGAASVRYRR